MSENKNGIGQSYGQFLETLKLRVLASRYQAARSVNKELIFLYHHIGGEILKSQQEYGWGAKIIDQLSKDLHAAFPEIKGFSPRNLKYIRKFAREYPDAEFVQQVVAQLPWGHHACLLDRIPNQQDRIFYIKQAIEHGWSRNVMVVQIERALHERQGKAITNFKEKLPSVQSDLAYYARS